MCCKYNGINIVARAIYIVYQSFMEKLKLIKILKKILKTDRELDFLLKLKKEELETLIAIIRDRIE